MNKSQAWEQALRQGTEFSTTQSVAQLEGCKHSVEVHFYKGTTGNRTLEKVSEHGKDDFKSKAAG